MKKKYLAFLLLPILTACFHEPSPKPIPIPQPEPIPKPVPDIEIEDEIEDEIKYKIPYNDLLNFFKEDISKNVKLTISDDEYKAKLEEFKKIKPALEVEEAVSKSPFYLKDYAYNPEPDQTYYLTPGTQEDGLVYLGAIFSGKNMRDNPTNVLQWSIPNNQGIHLVGDVTVPSNNIRSKKPWKNLFLSADKDFLKNTTVSKNPRSVLISGSLVSDEKSKSKSNTIDFSLDFKKIETKIGNEYTTKYSISDKKIRVTTLAKIYSLNLNKVKNISFLDEIENKEEYYDIVNPKNYPVYVSSMDYGFAVTAEIDTTNLSSETINKIKLGIGDGIASADFSTTLSDALSSEKISGKYTYYGTNTYSNNIPNFSSTSYNVVMNNMANLVNGYMQNFENKPFSAIPLSAKFKYLYPINAESNTNLVNLKKLFRSTDIYKIPEYKLPTKEVKATILKSNMVGVQEGMWPIPSYDDVNVFLTTKNESDISDYGDLSLSYWWYYPRGLESKNISESQHENRGLSVFTIKDPKFDQLGGFYVYGYFANRNSVKSRAKNKLVFDTLQRSDQKIYLEDIKKDNIKKISFFDGDISFDIKF